MDDKNLEKKAGYLLQDFRLFHIQDQLSKEFEFHYHDFHKIIFFLSGNVTYQIEGKSYYLKPQDLLLVNQYALHKAEVAPTVPYDRIILWIRPDLPHLIQGDDLYSCFRKASDRSFNLIRLHEELQRQLQDLFLHLEKVSKSQEFGASQLNQALFVQLMVYLNRIFLEKKYIRDQETYSCDKQIQDLLRYINHNLSDDLSIEILSQKYYLSKYHLMRKFKAQTGYTLHSYILQKRLLLARTLIQQGISITTACTQSGFGDYTTFSRAYKKQFHVTPSSHSPLGVTKVRKPTSTPPSPQF